MEKIKILYFTQDWTNYVDKTRHLFKQTLNLREDVEVYYIERAGDISAILAEIDFQPDFIYNEDFMLNRLKYGPIKGFNQIDIPSGVMFYDIRRMRNKFKGYVLHNKIDLTFACYRDRFLTKYPDLLERFRWLPLFVDTNYFKDIGITRENDFLFLGDITPKVYPIRYKILQTMLNEPGFIYHRHPGYRSFNAQEHENLIIGENYVREINKSKMFLTCGSKYNYVLGKYFEVPACNTLLLATGSKEHQDLGFIDGETFVEINEDNFREKAFYYLTNEEERLAIAKRGYDMIRNNHSVEVRVEQFVNYIREYLEKGLKIK